jgi:hypothetical protein
MTASRWLPDWDAGRHANLFSGDEARAKYNGYEHVSRPSAADATWCGTMRPTSTTTGPPQAQP